MYPIISSDKDYIGLMVLFPNQPNDDGLVFLIVFSQVLATAIACGCIHYASNFFFLWKFRENYEPLSDVDKRGAQLEATSLVLTCFLVPLFIVGLVELSVSVEE